MSDQATGGNVDVIATTSLADEIASRVAAMILDGVYQPGDRLMQDEMCERFGVSRTPVREALRKLQAQNLVVVTPNRGATIRIPTRAELEDGWAIRAELEGFAVALACERATSATWRSLDGALVLTRSGIEQLESPNGDELVGEHAVRDGNEAFHSAILDAAGNAQLRTICVALQSYLPKEYHWRAVRAAHAEFVLNVDEHESILRALRAADRETAREAMRAHLTHARDILLDYLGEKGFWTRQG